MKISTRKKVNEILLPSPSMIWLILWFVIPTVIVFLMAFKPVDAWGGIGSGWTLQTIRELSNPNYPEIVVRTLALGVGSPLISILIALPLGYYLARVPKKLRDLLLLLIIIPFWTNFLIRIFAWKVLLHAEGPLARFLIFGGVLPQDATLLYNPWAVLAVMVYSYLPFAILPVYAAAEKFDFSLIEAAQDLGATRLQAFFRVFIPGISRGIWTAIIVVLIPALGAYLIPDLVGGTASELIGDKIAQRTFIDRNLPHASALSALLMFVVMIPIFFVVFFTGSRKSITGTRHSRGVKQK